MQQQQATFLWIDYETFGVKPALDKACQFAAIRTDMDFNQIGEPINIMCRPAPDYLPSAGACLVTGITPQQAMQNGLSEPEFFARIHQEMSQPNTCTVGYNNIRFDDEVTRYGLYRNFFDPYAWAYKNGNSRWDIIDLLRTCYALRPDGIEWPEDEEGFPTFRLEKLSVANGIQHANAHDALADVYATIEMAKKVKQSQPKLFDFYFNLRHKNKVNQLIDIAEAKPLVHISAMLGKASSNTSWMVPMAWHPVNKNAVIMVNLAQDPSPLFELSADELRERLYTKRDELAQGELPVPVKLVHINKCPSLAPAKALLPENAARIGIDREACLRHLKQLQQRPEIREKLVALFANETPFEPSINVDEQLYSGFFSEGDQHNMQIIRETHPNNLPALDLAFQDPRLEKLLFNYRARNFPATLNESEMQRWHSHCRTYFEQQLPTWLDELNSLTQEHQNDNEKMAILKQVYLYVEDLAQ